VTTATVVLPAVPVRPPPVVIPQSSDRGGFRVLDPLELITGAGTVESR
jgi:hypothetical protein